MLLEISLAALTALAGGFGVARWRRALLYRKLDSRIGDIQRLAPPFGLPEAARSAPDGFAQRLAACPDCLPQSQFAKIRAEALGFTANERSFVPAHKKGGTIAYETLIAEAPALVALYHDRSFQSLVSSFVGAPLQPTPLNDQSSLSVLCYERPGDHIGWHYDHNFYRGRHFTVLIALVNEGRADGGLSHAQLMARLGGEEKSLATPPNMLVVFEGARVHHRVTPILEGERRIMLSMTYCTDPRARWWQGLARRMKDTAFFGVRALWT